ncbi:MAG: autotransporter-associated beta strand repeat-containing protein [Chthoniobacteraceae bacterium]
MPSSLRASLPFVESSPLRPRRSCIPACLGASVATLLFANPPSTHAANWLPDTGDSWATGTNWDTGIVPDAVGASANFFFTAPAANRTITNDSGAAGFTVGSILFNLDNGGTRTNSLTTGTSGSKLILDNGGAGVTITTMGTGTGNSSISVPTNFAESVTAIVNQEAATSAAGSLNLTATITGFGGFTKEGDGVATFGTGAKTYAGATVLSGGRMRISVSGMPTATSSFTINAGAQFTPITAGTYSFGSGPLNLNGSGPTTGAIASFPGAIRGNTNLAASIANPTVLQSDTLLHVEGMTSGSLTFTNTVSGPGQLIFTAPDSSSNQGQLVLEATNSYSGGTLINGGTLLLSLAGSLGTGDIFVDNLLSPDSNAVLRITTGVLDAIADTATLSLAGGGFTGFADTGFVDLETGVNETVGSLLLGGMMQGAGTYGSTTSAASFQNDEYFSGDGIVTVVPEPGAVATMVGSLGLLLLGRRRRQGI